MSNLGRIFRQIRLNKNWSIREAAKRIGISYSYLSLLEKGVDPRTGKDSNPRPETLRSISEAYGMPYTSLLEAAGYLDSNPDTSAANILCQDEFLQNQSNLSYNELMIFSYMSEDLRKWITSEENLPYIKIAIEAQHKNIDPQSLKMFIALIEKERSHE